MRCIRQLLAAATTIFLASSLTAQSSAPPLVGTWTLTAADDIRPDGTRVQAYGQNPIGLLVFCEGGRYSVQIFRSDRASFASGDKRRGTAAEYEAAALGMSSHFGRYTVDSAGGTITFHIEAASFANWNGTQQKRPFTLSGDELEWRVPATPTGTVPVSAWHRAR